MEHSKPFKSKIREKAPAGGLSEPYKQSAPLCPVDILIVGVMILGRIYFDVDLIGSTLGPATDYKVVIVPVCACEWDQMFVYGQHVAYQSPPSSRHHSALLTQPSLA